MPYRHRRRVELPTAHARRRPAPASAIQAGARPLQGVPIRCGHNHKPIWNGAYWECAQLPGGAPPPPYFGQMQIGPPPSWLLSHTAADDMQIGPPPSWLLSYPELAQHPALASRPAWLDELAAQPPHTLQPFEPADTFVTPPAAPPSPVVPPTPIAPPSPVVPPGIHPEGYPGEGYPDGRAECDPCYSDVAALVQQLDEMICCYG